MIEEEWLMMLKQSRLSLTRKLGHAREKWVLWCRCVVRFPFSGLKKLQDLVLSLTLSVRIFNWYLLFSWLSKYYVEWYNFILISSFSVNKSFDAFVLMSVQRYDPTYQATKQHFEDLASRYGNPIIVLNLIKVILDYVWCRFAWFIFSFKIIILDVFSNILFGELVSHPCINLTEKTWRSLWQNFIDCTKFIHLHAYWRD